MVVRNTWKLWLFYGEVVLNDGAKFCFNPFTLSKVILASTRENPALVVCEQQMRRPACAFGSLISAFVFRLLEIIIFRRATREISIFS